MKKIAFLLIISLFSFPSFSFNLDGFEFTGVWKLKSISNENKTLFEVHLNKTHDADPIGFRHSYYDVTPKSKDIVGLGIFILPSVKSKIFSYFIRLNSSDHQFHLFEILGTRGFPINGLYLENDGSRYILSISKETDLLSKHKLND